MRNLARVLRIAGLIVAISSALVLVPLNIIMAAPFALLVVLLWREPNFVSIVYLSALSVIFCGYGVPDVVKQEHYHVDISTFNDYGVLLTLAFLLMIPVVIARILGRFKKT